MKNYESPFLPSYAPFSLYDTTLFSDSVITSISFPFDSLSTGYTVDSDKLYMPIYVIKSDFSTKKNECTVENGKKIILDFTGKLSGVKRGDWITVDDLAITVGYDETIAFGDTDMAVLPMFLRNDATHGFWNRIFDSKGGNNHSLIFNVKGYKNKEDSDTPNENGKKYISFLGDSISTYSGWSNNTSYNNSIGGNAIWYPNNNYSGANLTVKDTWWHKVADELGYEIAVNNSWSGSVVNTAQTYNVRAKNLHNTSNGAKPDVVVIFMGVNDYSAGATVGSYDGKSTPPTNPSNFSEAYGRTIQNILDTYEGVEVYCCTFLPDRKRFTGSQNKKGIDESEYNEAIRTIAKNMGVNLIDLYKDSGITPENISQFTVDRLHPNKDGMAKVSNVIVNAINK
jgi:lysophospholipase L1-like esterase